MLESGGMVEIAGLLLIGGAVLFWIGAGLPTWKVYVTSDPDVQAQLISDLHGHWVASHAIFLAGTVATAAGLGVFTAAVEAADARPVAVAGSAAIILGTVAWVYVVFVRLSVAAEEWVRSQDGWAFPAYTVLTLTALMLFGIVLLMTGYPIWLGWVTIGLSTVLLVAFFIQRDSIPLTFYIASLIVGITLFLHGG